MNKSSNKWLKMKKLNLSIVFAISVLVILPSLSLAYTITTEEYCSNERVFDCYSIVNIQDYELRDITTFNNVDISDIRTELGKVNWDNIEKYNSTAIKINSKIIERVNKWSIDKINLDPFFNSSWALCTNITITNDGITRTNDVNVFNFTNLTFTNANTELRVVNTFCDNGGIEIPSHIISNSSGDDAGNDWALVVFPSNISTSDVQLSIYYNNSDAEDSRLIPVNTTFLDFSWNATVDPIDDGWELFTFGGGGTGDFGPFVFEGYTRWSLNTSADQGHMYRLDDSQGININGGATMITIGLVFGITPETTVPNNEFHFLDTDGGGQERVYVIGTENYKYFTGVGNEAAAPVLTSFQYSRLVYNGSHSDLFINDTLVIDDHINGTGSGLNRILFGDGTSATGGGNKTFAFVSIAQNQSLPPLTITQGNTQSEAPPSPPPLTANVSFSYFCVNSISFENRTENGISNFTSIQCPTRCTNDTRINFVPDRTPQGDLCVPFTVFEINWLIILGFIGLWILIGILNIVTRNMPQFTRGLVLFILFMAMIVLLFYFGYPDWLTQQQLDMTALLTLFTVIAIIILLVMGG